MRDSRGRFIKGSIVGKEYRFKKGQHSSLSTEFKKGELSNEKHPCWKGDEVSYMGLHKWIDKHFIKENICEFCNTDVAKRYEWANITGVYNRIRENWVFLCKKCHNNFDDITNKGWKTRRGKNAIFT